MPAASLPHHLLPLRIDVPETFHGAFVIAESGDRILLQDDQGFLNEPASWLPDAGIPACALVERWLMTRPYKSPSAWTVADSFTNSCSLGTDCHSCDMRNGDLVPNAIGNRPQASC